MTQKSNHLVFKDAWTFPDQVEKRISGFVNNHPGVWLHAPVGISELGRYSLDNNVRMLTLDIDGSVNPDIVSDIFEMKKNEKIRSILKYRGGFDGVISDPVWYTEEKNKTVGLSYPKRRYLSYAVRDVLRPGGYWLFNGLWNPWVKGLEICNVEVPMQQFSSFRNVSLLVYCRRVNYRL